MYIPQITVERIKEMSSQKGVPMSHLNDLCELSKNTITQSGKGTEGMKAKNLYSIAEVLDCSVDYLLGRTDTPKPEAEHTHIEQNHQYIQNDSSPIVFAVPSGNALDEMQKELLSRFGELSFTEKLEFMQELVEKTKK